MTWYVNRNHIKSVSPSFAEKRIMVALKNAGIPYYREVSFKYCNSPKGFPLVFDFYFPERNLLIEYDGADHQKSRVKVHDFIKNTFARLHKIRLVRLNKANWIDLEKKLLKVLKVKKSKKLKKLTRPKDLIQDKRVMTRKQIREHLRRH